MNGTWTDEELGRLLGDTFASREALADPDRARQVAALVEVVASERRRWPAYLAAAAAVLVIAGGTSLVVVHQGGDRAPSADHRHPSTHPTASTDAPAQPGTFEDHYAKAASESQRVLGLVELPDGAQRLAGQPAGWPDLGSFLGGSDPTLTRTSWWSVGADVETVQAFLLAHTPDGMVRDDGVGGSGDGTHWVREITYRQPASTDPVAHASVELWVDFSKVDGQTVIKAYTFTAARVVRPSESVVTGTVTSVDIDRIVHGTGIYGRRLPTVHLAEPADHAAIARLVDAFNGLPGSTSPPIVASCPAVGTPTPSDTLTFHTDAGEWRVHLETWCFGQVQVTVQGTRLRPTLDPGDLDQVVQAVATQH